MPRPKAIIDEALVAELAALGCSKRTISVKTGVSVRTLERRSAALLSLGAAEREIWLLRQQRAAAERGNAQLLIWLGRQIGQTEVPSQEKAPDTVLRIVRTPAPATGT